jgi:hypothetical protein
MTKYSVLIEIPDGDYCCKDKTSDEFEYTCPYMFSNDYSYCIFNKDRELNMVKIGTQVGQSQYSTFGLYAYEKHPNCLNHPSKKT